MQHLCNIFASNSIKEVSGTKLWWAEEITTDAKVIDNVLFHCNINRCNMYNSNITKKVEKGKE